MFDMNVVNRRIWSLVVLAMAALLLSVAAVTAQGPTPQGTQAALGPGFTYQGQLKSSSAPFSGSCSMQFSLWDSPSNGTQVGSKQTTNGVNVVNGLFTVQINNSGQFGASAFDGNAR